LRELKLDIEPPAHHSFVAPGGRKTYSDDPASITEVYPNRQKCEGLTQHITFALKSEPLDFRVWQAVMDAMPPEEITSWVERQPTSRYSRTAWYLYERLTAKELPLPDANNGPYYEIANDQLQLTWQNGSEKPPASTRHRIFNNLLGNSSYCPLIRRTPRIQTAQASNFSAQAASLLESYPPEIFARAAQHLFLAETKSSFDIENEKASPDREERFVQALTRAGTQEFLSEQALVELQNLIVPDPRYQATGWRTVQNYVGRTRHDRTEDVRYPCPKPEDVPALMNAWASSVRRGLEAKESDAVCVATLASFGFVYLHPFEDGNGRIHRFLLHHVMSHKGFAPPGVIFPISAVILRRMRDYDGILDSVSKLVRRLVPCQTDEEGFLHIEQDTVLYYRYPDLTLHAQFIYECVERTLREDWPESLRYLSNFDAIYNAVQAIVDMTSRELRLMTKLLLQNKGELSKAKRPSFPKLKDEEIARMEAAAGAILQEIAA
jgi:Fic family protein